MKSPSFTNKRVETGIFRFLTNFQKYKEAEKGIK